MFKEEVIKPEKKYNKIYYQVKELVLNSKNYSFHEALDLIKEHELDEGETIIYILERFYKEEGALPGHLSIIYLKSLLASDLFSQDIYEKIREVKDYLRKKQIKISKEDLAQVVGEYTKLN